MFHCLLVLCTLQFFEKPLSYCHSLPALDAAVPASTMWDVRLLPLLSAAAVGGAASVAAQRNRRPQGRNDAARLEGVDADSPGRVNGQTGSALLLNPAATGAGAGGPGPPRPPGAVELLQLCPQLLLILLWPLGNLCRGGGGGGALIRAVLLN